MYAKRPPDYDVTAGSCTSATPYLPQKDDLLTLSDDFNDNKSNEVFKIIFLERF